VILWRLSNRTARARKRSCGYTGWWSKAFRNFTTIKDRIGKQDLWLSNNLDRDNVNIYYPIKIVVVITSFTSMAMTARSVVLEFRALRIW